MTLPFLFSMGEGVLVDQHFSITEQYFNSFLKYRFNTGIAILSQLNIQTGLQFKTTVGKKMPPS